MPITLNHSNISVQYSSDKSYIIETVKSDLYRKNDNIDTIIRNNIQTAPVIPIVSIQEGSNVYAVESYTYSGSANTADFTRVFTKSTTCDILVVGGGGGGGYFGGGGGGGAILFANNLLLNAGSYTIKVGKGGTGASNDTANGTNGINSSISINAIEYIAKGGGGGGTRNVGPNHFGRNGNEGGSGGGGSHADNSPQGLGGGSNKNTYTNWLSYGNNGGTGKLGTAGASPTRNSGGGGGAGSIGANISSTGGGNGGTGISFVSTFGSSVGHSGWFGGGGGGNTYYNAGNPGYGNGGNGLLGGGGNGGFDGVSTLVAQDGLPNTGGGGGGSKIDGGTAEDLNGGHGGSGIVIIRYLLGTIPANNILTNEPVVIAPAFTETIRTFMHSGGTEAQTTHTITVGRDTICDILIVGGGGAGGTYIGGGGGAGGVLYITNCTIPVGTYNIQVGKGGAGVIGGASGTTAQNGSSSKAFGIEVFGGGYGGVGQWGTSAAQQAGANGGSGGGGGSTFSVSPGTGGTVIQPSFTSSVIIANNYTYYGGNGAAGLQYNNNSFGTCGANGGGGAGGNAPANTDLLNAGAGADGIAINITGTSYFWGGGGGGGQYGGTYNGKAGNGGKGGGGGGSGSQVPDQVGIGGIGGISLGQDGDLEGDGTPTAGNGGSGTGGGGGGCGRTVVSPNAVSGSGGSGIVIIKFKSTTPILEGITHKRLNFLYNNDNLVAWYRFNGDYFDSSGNGHNLTNVGTVIQSTQIIEGQAVEFDSTDYLEFPATINPYTIWNNGKGITFSCWVRFTAHETWARILDFQSAVNTSTGFYIAVKTNWSGIPAAILMNIAEVTTFSYSNWSNSVLTNLGVWHHIVWSIDVNGKWDVYLNNVRINNTETQAIPNITYNVRYINKSAFSGDGTWDGQMDDFRIYDRALSATDVAMLYNKTYPIPNLYTLNFPVPTIADINNNSNIVLRGAYDIALSTTNAVIIPKSNQYIPKPTTFSTSNISLLYNLLNPILDPIGAQWTYSSNNTNVYHLGNVGIGTTTPEYTLDVRGAIYSSTGGYTSSTLTKWSVLSDRRIKENIVKASYDKCLENVKNIELYNFNFKDNCVNTNDRHQLGFIAQEVQQVYPKAVEVGKMIVNLEQKIDDLLTLNITQIDYTLYGAVKSLIEKIENIKIKMEHIKTTYDIP